MCHTELLPTGVSRFPRRRPNDVVPNLLVREITLQSSWFSILWSFANFQYSFFERAFIPTVPLLRWYKPFAWKRKTGETRNRRRSGRGLRSRRMRKRGENVYALMARVPMSTPMIG